MPRISRFRRYNSDRSGFTYFKIGLVKDGPYLVAPDEFDQPPPSRRNLGGEGEIALGDMRAGSNFTTTVTNTDTPTGSLNPLVYITAAGGITPNTHPFMYIGGSNQAVTISANPQIVAGKQNQLLTLFCADSGVTLQNGNGIATMGSAIAVLTSGRIISFMYQTGGSVWQETSRA